MAKKKMDLNLSTEERVERALIPNWDEPYKLPDNWCWTKLGNVAEWGSGGTPSRKCAEYYLGSIPWIKTGELEDAYIYQTEEHISENAIANSSAKLFPINTIIIAMYGATIGKVGIMGIEATTNQACACGVCSSAINYKYLFYYAISQRDAFIKKGKGGAQPNISQEVIKQHEIPLAPLGEQQRIVERIDALFTKLDDAKDRLEIVLGINDNVKSVVGKIDLMKKAILKSAFHGELGTNDPAEENAMELLKRVIREECVFNKKINVVSKKVLIPSEIKPFLSNVYEEEIFKLLMKADSEGVTIQEIMSLNSKNFELMDSLRNLEKKNLIIKNEEGKYILKR